MKLFRKGLLLSRQIPSVKFESAALNGIGMIFRSQREYDSAIQYLNNQQDLIGRMAVSNRWLKISSILGGLYLQDLSDAAKGRNYILQAASIYHSMKSWNNFISSINVLFDWYLKNGDRKGRLGNPTD